MFKGPVVATGLTEASQAAAVASAAGRRAGSSLRLYLAPSCLEYQWKRMAIIANLAQIPLETFKVTEEELSTLVAHARGCVLQTKEGYLTQTKAIARYLAGLRPDLGLAGASEADEPFVDQWMEFCWYELEVLLGALLLPSTAEFDPKAVAQAVSTDIIKALQVLDAHLADKTFVAGSRLSIADVHLAVVTSELLGRVVKEEELLALPHLARWFLTCANHPIFKAVLGSVSLKSAPGPKKAATAPPTKAAAGGAAAGGAAAKKAGKPAAAAKPAVPAPAMRFKRKRIRIAELMQLGTTLVGKTVVVQGWAKTIREAGKGSILFIQLSDGSSSGDVQVVVDAGVEGFEAARPNVCGGTDASFSISGKVVESQGAGQSIELQAVKVEVLGQVFAGDGDQAGGKFYPLARNRKGHSFEFLRSVAHLRPRTRAFAAVQRVRSAMAYATHQFFNERGFLYIHTPLITGADCEGAGEMFSVTTLIKDPKEPLPTTKDGAIDFSKDFFGAQTGLTVSGQLNVETHCCSLSDVYTFGPTFRAENSHTSRHLAEFWMIEPEIAFAQLEDDMDLAEDYLKHCVHYALTVCGEDLAALEKVPSWDSELRSRLMNILERPFTRLTYTEAISILEKEVASGKVTFQEAVSWGIDMGSEHERYLAEQYFKGPIIVTNYPKDIKAFYMKVDPDGKTVQAMDILVPRIGEIIGGSVREDRFDVLKQRAAEMQVAEEDIHWYLDLRKYGSVPHAGFGLGFERLVMLVTGVENIRDVIPFPRYPGNCEF